MAIERSTFDEFGGIANPGVSGAGKGRVYFDSTSKKLRVSEDGGAFAEAIGGTPNEKFEQVGITIDGGGAVITTGVKGFIQIPYGATIVGWTLLSTDPAATAGSIVIDVWKDTYANYPPTVADTIAAAAKPTLSAVNKNTDSTLTGWTTTVAAGDIFGFNVDSVATLTKVTLLLKLSKTT